MRDFVKRVALERAQGQRPSAPRAIAAALAVGCAAAVLAYRLLRHESEGA